MGSKIISVDWNSLFAWPGYDFWGIVIAILGFAASIFFAFRASTNAIAAANSADLARNSMIVADTASQLRIVQQILVEVRLRVENKQWEQVADKCETIRVIVAPLISSTAIFFEEDTRKSLVGMQSQMASLQKTADEVRHKG